MKHFQSIPYSDEPSFSTPFITEILFFMIHVSLQKFTHFFYGYGFFLAFWGFIFWHKPSQSSIWDHCTAIFAIKPLVLLFDLSKERPILGDHPKAHIHEIRRISCRFHEIWQISGEIWRILCRFHVTPAGFRKTNCQEW